MAQNFNARITVDGDLKNAKAAAPTVAKYKIQLPAPWNVLRYENVVLKLLETVDKSDVGGLVIKDLRRPLMIRPFIWSPDNNAFTIPDSSVAATKAGSAVSCTTPGATAVGTGVGSNVTMWFKPANRLVPDATLLHEIVHALRMMLGRRTCIPAAIDDFHRDEEYYAILIGNIFMSEKKRRLIRISHKPAAKSWVDVTSPWDQFQIDPFLITEFGIEHSTLALDIGRKSKAAFNPFSPRFSDKVGVGAN
jgi:hypothetical protein